MKKRILSVILAAAVILCVFPLGMFSAFAEGAEDAQSIGKYIERGWDDSAKKVTESEEDIPTGATVITGNTSTLAEGEWYVVASDVTVSGTITVEGTESSPTNLVLMDGYTLTVREGIVLNSGKFLNIYGQKNNTGKIKATGEVDAAGIGGSGHAKSGGTLTVHGGEVSATGGGFGAGIGGGEDGNGGTVTVYGGEVNATGGAGGAGIGGGKRFVSVGSTATVVGNGGKGGNVYIYGGAVTAFANPDIYQIDKCGIGIGYGANATESGKLEINASAIIKAGGNANGAEAVEAYGGERYVQIHYHTGEILKSISDTHHQCPYCGMTEEHSFQNNRCICGKYEKYYIARSWNNTTKKVVSEEKGTPADAKQITAGTTTLTNGWYILTEDVQIPYKTTLTVTGDNVNIILSDGCTLSTSAGIIINNGAVLNIYGQIKDTGKIDADNSTDGAAIDNNGTLNIYGGSVKAKGDYSGAGIGGGENEGGGTVYIYGGTVNALGGGNGGAGIGGGRNGIGGNVYVYGGNVKATGGDGGAGIGGGHHSSSGGNVYVYGGNVEAKGGYNGAGIGGGRSGIGGNVYVYGGNVKATGGDSGAGIGGGHSSKGGNFYFYSGTVEAQSGNDSGMGIGCGNGAADPRKFVINDKAITGIKAGYNSASAEFVSADGYNDERYSYVNIFICANHVDEDGDGWCDKCGKFTVKNYTVLDHAYRESGNEPNNFSGNILLSGDVTLNNPVVINGNVTLYIADTMTLTALKGIVLNEGNSLTITSQTVSGGVEAHGDVGAAGIGGAVGKNAGSLTINGGMSIFAYGGLGAPGIGGGLGGKDGEFIQNGSSVYTENGTGYVHEHTFAGTYTYDENHHWRACTCEDDACKVNVTGFGEHNYNVTKEGNVTTYTCKVCGYKEYDYGAGDTETEPASGTVGYYGISLTLSSDISINFYMLLTETQAENGVMTFTVGDKTFIATAQYNETEKKYFFRCPLNTLQIATTVTAKFTYGGETYTKQYSVKEYCATVIANADGKFDTKSIALCEKIANYGYFAQTYLATIHAGVVIGEEGYAEMTQYGTPDVDAAKTALQKFGSTDDCNNKNILGVARSLNLDDKIGMNFYITVADGYELTENMITVSGEKDFTLEKVGKNEYRITVKNIEAKNFGENYTLKIDGEIITASVLSYANKIVNGDHSTEFKNSMAALYEYYVAAVAFSGK